MKIVAVSDLHGHLPTIPEADLLIIAGDICPAHNHAISYQQLWLNTDFRAWLDSVPVDKIIGIAGNHDLIFERASDCIPRSLRWTYLRDSGTEYEGLNLWGSPCQPRFCDWAFNLDEPDLAAKWELIPEGTDILITHGPPRGYGDRVRCHVTPIYTSAIMSWDTAYEHVGSPSLLSRIDVVRPRLAIFGHIHPGHGSWQRGGTTLLNVAMTDDSYQLVHEPTVIGLV